MRMFLPRRLQGRDGERGTTVIELLTTIALLGFVMSAVLGLLESGIKAAPREQERAHAIREAQAGLYRMVRELRQAYAVRSSTPHSLEVLVRIPKDDPSTPAVETHVNRHVRYSCGDDAPSKCIRYETAVGQPLPATGETVVARVLNWGQSTSDPAVFEFEDSQGPNSLSPTYVKVRIEVPAGGESKSNSGYGNKVVLEDGFFARNLQVQG
jgi:type II secretory pathway pseudopilin PulG